MALQWRCVFRGVTAGGRKDTVDASSHEQQSIDLLLNGLCGLETIILAIITILIENLWSFVENKERFINSWLFTQISKTGCWCLTLSQLCENNNNDIKNNNNDISNNSKNNDNRKIMSSTGWGPLAFCIYTKERTNKKMDERTNEWMNEWTNKQTCKQTNG